MTLDVPVNSLVFLPPIAIGVLTNILYNPLTFICQYIKTIFVKGNINMEKQKRITLNADKRKVIADVFQNHFEDNSKFKKAWQQAKETYNNLREQAKIKICLLYTSDAADE